MDGAVKKPNRSQRMKRALTALHGEVAELQALAHSLLGHLEEAIRPSLTDADRLRLRCMIQDIRDELNEAPRGLPDRIVRG